MSAFNTVVVAEDEICPRCGSKIVRRVQFKYATDNVIESVSPGSGDTYAETGDDGLRHEHVELQSVALQDELTAAMTISHELHQLRTWRHGLNAHDEAAAETAAELTQMYHRS